MSCNQIDNNIFHRGNQLLLTYINEQQLSMLDKDVCQVFHLVVLKLSQQILIYSMTPWPSKVLISVHNFKQMSSLSEADGSTYWFKYTHTLLYTVGSESTSC